MMGVCMFAAGCVLSVFGMAYLALSVVGLI